MTEEPRERDQIIAEVRFIHTFVVYHNGNSTYIYKLT